MILTEFLKECGIEYIDISNYIDTTVIATNVQNREKSSASSADIC